MPFGWGAADSPEDQRRKREAQKLSPMPFGWGAADSAPSDIDCEDSIESHQCLSAGGLLTPSR